MQHRFVTKYPPWKPIILELLWRSVGWIFWGVWEIAYAFTCLWVGMGRSEGGNNAVGVLSWFPIKVITRTTSPTLCCSEPTRKTWTSTHVAFRLPWRSSMKQPDFVANGLMTSPIRTFGACVRACVHVWVSFNYCTGRRDTYFSQNDIANILLGL
jgi:hypothetical protein